MPLGIMWVASRNGQAWELHSRKNQEQQLTVRGVLPSSKINHMQIFLKTLLVKKNMSVSHIAPAIFSETFVLCVK